MPGRIQWSRTRHASDGELAFKGGGTDSSARIGTPEAFRDLLLSIARATAKTQPGAGEDR